MAKKAWKQPLLKKLKVLLTENGPSRGADFKGWGKKHHHHWS